MVHLKRRTQCERWEQTLQDTLVSIIGTNGFNFSYVIKEVDAPNYAGHGTWKENSIAIAILTGNKLLAGAKTLGKIIYSNIYEYSDAYTWIKLCPGGSNGRLDMVALRGHFSGDVADQVLGGQAIINLDKIFTEVSIK